MIGQAAAHIPPQFIERQYGDTVTKRVWLAGTEGMPEMLGRLGMLLSE